MNTIFKQCLLVIVFFMHHTYLLGETVAIAIDAKGLHKKAKMSMAIVVPNYEKDQAFNQLIALVQKLLDRPSWQVSGFTVTITPINRIHNNTIIQSAQQKDVALSLIKNGIHIEWRLFDVHEARMIRGGRFVFDEKQLLFHAEGIADQVMYLLTGQKPFFRTRIAFCKEIIEKNGTVHKQLCSVPPYIDPLWPDYDQFVKVLVRNRTVLAPRWNKDQYMPLLFYSQVSDTGVLLMSVNGRGRRSVVSAVGGINTQPSFSADGNNIMYCVAQDGKSSLHRYHIDEQGAHEKVFITNHGNNWSPRLCAQGDVFFCTDSFSKKPQIAWFHADTESIENVTPQAYAVGPDFSDERGLLCYSKQIGNYLQLCFFDPATKKEILFTHDACNKHECSWSPCGTYITCCIEPGNIAVYHTKTEERVIITKKGERCLYPAWSWWSHVPL